jgi:putative phage-type endonuclease
MPDDAEWHAWRGKGIGGSDIAALLGLSNYESAYSLWCAKVGLTTPSETTDRQRIGQVLEHALGILFHEKTGLHIAGEQTWCEAKQNPTWRCTTDGFAVESPDSSIDDALGIVQHKTDGRFGWPDGPPVNIRAQCIWEMGVTGLPHAWLSVMFAGFRYEVFELDWADPAVQADWALMTDRATAFWQHVVSGDPPPLDASDATTRALGDVYAEPDPDDILEVDDVLMSLIREYDALGRHIRANEAKRDGIGNTIRLALGTRTDATHGLDDKGKPRTVCTWRPQSTTRIDAKAVRAAHGDKFDNTTTSRVLRVSLPNTTHKEKP